MNYETATMLNPSYVHQKLIPAEGNSATLSATAVTRRTIELPPNSVFNLSKSFLKFKFTLASSGASKYNHIYSNILPFSNLVLRDQSGKRLCDLSIANKFFNLTCMDNITFEELRACRISTVGTAAAPGFQLVRVCDALDSAIHSDLLPNTRADGTTISIDYLEPAYILTHQAAATATVLNYMIPFNLIKRCIMSQDVDICHNQVLYLDFDFLPVQNWAYFGTSASNPSSGAAAHTAGGSLANIEFSLALEATPEIAQSVRDKYLSSGLDFLIDYPTVFTSSLSGTSQNVSVKVNAAHGLSLDDIYAAPYHATETANTAYERSNIDTSYVGTNIRVSSLDVLVDDRKINQSLISCAWGTDDDLDYMERFLKGKMLPSARTCYSVSWYWRTNFKNVRDSVGLLGGKNLTKNEVKFAIQATTPSITNNWLIVAICSRRVLLAPGSVSIQ
jgi:hypothetical protein